MKRTFLWMLAWVAVGIATTGSLCRMGLADDQALTSDERQLVAMTKFVVVQLTVTKDVRVEVANAPEALEITIHYHTADQDALFGPSGISVSALRTLMNEMAIANQRDGAKAAGKTFNLRERKLILISFHKVDG